MFKYSFIVFLFIAQTSLFAQFNVAFWGDSRSNSDNAFEEVSGYLLAEKGAGIDVHWQNGDFTEGGSVSHWEASWNIPNVRAACSKDYFYMCTSNHDEGDAYQGQLADILPSNGQNVYYSMVTWDIPGSTRKVHLLTFDLYMSTLAEQWDYFQPRLAAIDPNDWVAALWHEPSFNGMTYKISEGGMKDMFMDLLMNNGGDLILNGHAHQYRRTHVLDADGNLLENGGGPGDVHTSPDGSMGMVHVVNGRGGVFTTDPTGSDWYGNSFAPTLDEYDGLVTLLTFDDDQLTLRTIRIGDDYMEKNELEAWTWIRPNQGGAELTTIEAEDCSITNGIITAADDASAGEKVDINTDGQISCPVNEVTGVYDLTFRIRVPSEPRNMGVFVDNVKVGVIGTSSSDWVKQTISSVSLGNTIEVRDSEGTMELDIDKIDLKLLSQTAAPTVEITSPNDGAQFNAPANVSVTVGASVDDGGTITKIELRQDGVLVGEATSVSSYTFELTGLAAGIYSLQARAYDDKNVSSNTAISITVIGDQTLEAEDCSYAGGSVKPAGDASGGLFVDLANTGVLSCPIIAPSTANITVTYKVPRKSAVMGVYADETKIGTISTSSLSWVSQTFSDIMVNSTIEIRDSEASKELDIDKIEVVLVSQVTPPVVNITAPAGGADFESPADVTVTVDASDSDGTVSQVELRQNGTLVGTDASAPYAFLLSALTEGSYTLQARAYDNDGVTANDELSITVSLPATDPPVVSITAPANGADFESPADVTVTVDASDSDGTVSKVELRQNGTVVGTDTSAPYSFLLSGLTVGSYTLQARAYDNIGATANDERTITVSLPATDPPVVSITSPADASVFEAPADVTLTVNASDPDGSISKVELRQNGTLVQEDSSYPYGFSLTGLAAGSYTLQVRAYDNVGATADDEISVTVNASVQPIDIEAENCSVFKGETIADADASGGQYVDMDRNGKLTCTANVASGSYDLAYTIKAPGSTTARMGVYLNGIKIGVLSASSGSWTTQILSGISLSDGNNTLELKDSEKSVELDVDKLTITPVVLAKPGARGFTRSYSKVHGDISLHNLSANGVEFNLTRTGQYLIRLHTINGKMYTISGYGSAGTNFVPVKSARLSQGMYLVSLQAEGKILKRKLNLIGF